MLLAVRGVAVWEITLSKKYVRNDSIQELHILQKSDLHTLIKKESAIYGT